MRQFISCDWGTSTFRLRLIHLATMQVLAEARSNQGIAATYALWQQEPGADRITYFKDIILQKIPLLEDQYQHSLKGLTVVISGMASSSIGMMELPYTRVPYNVAAASLLVEQVDADTTDHPMILISGACTSNDVMRGEETILAGCNIENNTGRQLYIFPGTHSKHVVVENGLVIDFKTYLTGELFDLLSKKSVLAKSVENTEQAPEATSSFINGVQQSPGSNLLNSIFHVRTNQLFKRLSLQENYQYLSGLLIGEELKNIQHEHYGLITVVSAGGLSGLYMDALSALGHQCWLQNADEALIRGQALLFSISDNLKPAI